jgi:hypothetical protein
VSELDTTTLVQELTRSSTIFDQTNAPCIWDGHRGAWVTRGQCVFEGPDFISSKTVLKRTYSQDSLLSSFFHTVLSIPDCNIGDVLHELDARREGSQGDTNAVLTQDIYSYLNTNTHTDGDWSMIRYVARCWTIAGRFILCQAWLRDRRLI